MGGGPRGGNRNFYEITDFKNGLKVLFEHTKSVSARKYNRGAGHRDFLPLRLKILGWLKKADYLMEWVSFVFKISLIRICGHSSKYPVRILSKVYMYEYTCIYARTCTCAEMTLSWAVQPDPVLASTCVRRAALVALQGASFVKIILILDLKS